MLGRLQLFSAAIACLGAVQAATWHRPANCTSSECDAAHQCVSNICFDTWDSCTGAPDSQLLVQTRSEPQTDYSTCYDTGCSLGGCDRPGYIETDSKQCFLEGCFLCRRETCCLVRPRVQCCRRLNCTVELADCRIPQQHSLANSSVSSVQYTTIADGGTAQFPFYKNRAVPHGTSCDSVRVWGTCGCADGTAIPGCLFTDSSTWQVLEDPQHRLPANLSLTCVESPPAPPGGGGGGGGGGQPGQGQGDKPRPGPGPQPGSSGESHRRHLSGGAIAFIVIISVLGTLALVAGALAVWLFRKPEPDAWVDGRLASIYEPVFTGHTYNPEPKSRGSQRRFPTVRELASGFKQLIGKARGAVDDGGAGQAAFSSHRARLEARFAAKYPLSGPALPPDADAEEDDLYTLEDLDESPRTQFRQQFGFAGGGPSHMHAQGTEVELGSVPDRHGYTAGSIKQMRQPLHDPGAQASHSTGGASPHGHHRTGSFSKQHGQGEVIHTTPVHLGPAPPPAGSLGGRDEGEGRQPGTGQAGSRGQTPPITPQQTGQPASAPDRTD